MSSVWVERGEETHSISKIITKLKWNEQVPYRMKPISNISTFNFFFTLLLIAYIISFYYLCKHKIAISYTFQV